MNKAVLICLIFAIGAGVLFWADWVGYNRKVQTPVAFISEIEGTVKVMNRGNLTWDRCSSKTVLEEGDTLVTGENAYVKLEFYAGGELELDSGSMVVLTGALDDLQLNIMSGKGKLRISEKAKNKIKIAHGMAKAVSERPKLEVEYVEQIKATPRTSFNKEPKTIKPSETVNEVFEKTSARRVPEVKAIEIGGGYRTLVVDEDEKVDLKKGQRYEVKLFALDSRAKPKIIYSTRRNIRVGDLAPGKYTWNVKVVGEGARLPASNLELKVIRDYHDSSAPMLKPVKVEAIAKPKLEKVRVGENPQSLINKPTVK